MTLIKKGDFGHTHTQEDGGERGVSSPVNLPADMFLRTETGPGKMAQLLRMPENLCLIPEFT